MASLKALRCYGGKAGYGLAQWIAGQLPWDKETTYVEPCGGMFGVGLAREPVMSEVLNDLDERVFNWWRVLRDEPERFGHAVECTPHSRKGFAWAVAAQDDASLSDFDRALAYYIVANQGLSLSATTAVRWRRAKKHTVGSMGRWRSERVTALAERMWNVQLECRDAVQLLREYADLEAGVFYIDPPYRDADTTDYRHGVERSALSDVLATLRGRAAVSGYNDEWDHLGWRRSEKDAIRRQIGTTKSSPRIEVLWMNYD